MKLYRLTAMYVESLGEKQLVIINAEISLSMVSMRVTVSKCRFKTYQVKSPRSRLSYTTVCFRQMPPLQKLQLHKPYLLRIKALLTMAVP